MYEFIEIKADPERDWVPKWAIYDTVNSRFIEYEGEQAWDTFEEFCEVCKNADTQNRVYGLGKHFFDKEMKDE